VEPRVSPIDSLNKDWGGGTRPHGQPLTDQLADQNYGADDGGSPS